MSYFQTDEKNLEILNPNEVSELYNLGYVLTRKEKGNFVQTRSLRIKLSDFSTSSENRRILNKNEDLEFKFESLPLVNYSWQIHTLGKRFYSERFGDGTMSASKIKEMFTDLDKSNMNAVFVYNYLTPSGDSSPIGYTLAYENQKMLHYAYPFYDLEIPKERNLGMAMMLKAIVSSKEKGKEYIYLGSVVERKSIYKLQFSGLEWFDTNSKSWKTNLDELKELVEATASD